VDHQVDVARSTLNMIFNLQKECQLLDFLASIFAKLSLYDFFPLTFVPGHFMCSKEF
jgi:hypothetical protein